MNGLKYPKIATALFTIASSVTTWLGLRNTLEFAAYKELVSAMWGIFSGVGITVMWFFLYDWYPILDKKTQRYFLYTLPLAFALIFSSSTLFSIVSLGGVRVKMIHMEKTVIKAEEMFAEVSGEVAADVSLIASLKMFEEQFAGQSTDEELLGVLTGFDGRDVVVNQLHVLSATLGNLRTNLSQSHTDRERILEEIREEIRALRETINDSVLTLVEKDKAFTHKLSRLNDLFQQIRGGEITSTVSQIVRRLEDFSPSGQPGGKKIAKAQQNALDKVMRSVSGAKSILSNEIERRQRRTRALAILKPIAMSRGIFIYAAEIPGAWGGAISFDWFPGIFFLWITWTSKKRREMEIEQAHLEVKEDLQ